METKKNWAAKVLIVMMTILVAMAALSSCGGGKEKKSADTASNEEDYVDLTELSSTAVYAEVFNMVTKPEEYKDKTVKMKGTFATQVLEDSGKRLYACIIEDATACCAQGIEFECKGDLKYPDDYPKEGNYVTVEGSFDSYKIGEMNYCVLKKAKML